MDRCHYGVVNCVVGSVGNRGNHWSSVVDCVGNRMRYNMRNSMGNSMDSVVDWGHYWSCVVDSVRDNRVGHGVDGVGMRDGSRDGVVRGGVDSVVGGVVGIYRVSGVEEVTLGDRFGQEGVEQGVSVESVERGSLGTVDRVPGLTSEEVLVKQGAVWTNKSGTMWSVSSILTHSVGLTS